MTQEDARAVLAMMLTTVDSDPACDYELFAQYARRWPEHRGLNLTLIMFLDERRQQQAGEAQERLRQEK